MASTKLAGTCKAWRVTIGVDPVHLDGAFERCRELGFMPKVCGYHNKRALFSVLLLMSGQRTVIHPISFVKDYLGEFGGAVLVSYSEVELNCPLPEVQGQEEKATTGTVDDFRNFLQRKLAERMHYLLRSSEAFGDFMVRLNRLGGRNIESQPPESFPNIDATVQLTDQELQELETELLQILESVVSVEISPSEE